MKELQLMNDKLKIELLNKFKELGLNNSEAITLVVELVFEKNKAELLAKQTEASNEVTGNETLVHSSTGKTAFVSKNAWEKWK